MNTASVDSMPLIDVVCPICGSDSRHPQYKLKLGSIVSCGQCHVKYVTPRADWSHLQTKIDDWSSQDVNDDIRLGIAFAKSTQTMYRRFLAMVDSVHRIPGRKMLDVGCSTGAFINVATEQWQVEGLELGREAAAYTRERFNVPVQQCTIQQGDYAEQSFDCVAISEVIEHLEYPKADMEKLFSWLKPGGTLLLTTPNYDSLYRRLHGADWWVINCEDEHIILFNEQDLRSLLEQIGFEVQRVHFRGIDFAGILNTFRRRKHDPQVESETPVESADYYTERDRKEGLKSLLKKLGLKDLAHQAVWWLSYLFSRRWSPFYAWGEQVVIVATKPENKRG